MASGVSKVRFVRCPKCRQVLTEFTDIPVYKCGGCGTVLRAKNRNADRESITSGTLESISSQENLLEHVSESTEQTSNDGSSSSCKQINLCSTNGISPEMDCGKEKIAVPYEDRSRKESEQNCHVKGESSEIGENWNKEIGSDIDSPRPRAELALMETSSAFMAQTQPDQIVQAKVIRHSDEQMDSSLQITQHVSDNLRSRDKVEEPAESTDHCAISEEDTVDRALGDCPDDDTRIPPTNSKEFHAYDGNISSYDDSCNNRVPDQNLLLPKGTSEPQTVLSTKEVERGEVVLLNNKIGTESEAQVQGRILSLESSKERYGSAAMGSFDLNQDELPWRHGIRAYERETSRDSQDFYSVQNWMETEKDVHSRSQSRDSVSHKDFTQCKNGDPMAKYRDPEHDHKELLRKVDELRDHITRSYGLRGKGNRWSYIRGTRQGNWLPPFYSNEYEQQLQCCNSSIPHSSSRASGPRKTEPQLHHFSRIPFSGEANFSGLHCCHEDLQLSIKFPPNICCHNGAGRACCHPCSSATSWWSNMDSNLSMCQQESGKVPCKEKRHTMKRYCRPVLGGAPFVICYNCLQLLQLPADFFISRRKYHKLRCGACAEVNVFTMHDRAHVVPHSHSYEEIQHPPSEIDNSMDAVSGHEMPISNANQCLQGDPVSFSEEYGLSMGKSYSTEGEHILRVSPETIQVRDVDRRRMRSPLHRLMGYSSPSEIIN